MGDIQIYISPLFRFIFVIKIWVEPIIIAGGLPLLFHQGSGDVRLDVDDAA
jgi:hypothetical protein